MSKRKRILLVVDPAISDARVVRPSVRAVAEREASEVYVLAPLLITRVEWVTNEDDPDAVADAEERLASDASAAIRPRDRGRGTVGDDASIVTAVGDALAEFPADEIVIAVHTDYDRHWRERNLAERIRAHHSLPLTELLVDADGAASVRV